MASLWKPVTYGEELFLTLHDDLGSRIEIAGPEDIGTDFLVNPGAFHRFATLAATSEVFLRCVRSAALVHATNSGSPPDRFAQAVRRDLDLPPRLLRNTKFAERLKQVGRIVVDRGRDRRVENDAVKDGPNTCYLCGITLTQAAGHAQRTIEHIWPLSLGGETVENNIVLACHDCNSKRGHTMTWAHGPVHSTYYVRSSTNPTNPSADLRLSLALARLLQAAAPTRTRKAPLTLKDAIREIRPVVPDMDLDFDRPYVYFELLEHIRVSL